MTDSVGGGSVSGAADIDLDGDERVSQSVLTGGVLAPVTGPEGTSAPLGAPTDAPPSGDFVQAAALNAPVPNGESVLTDDDDRFVTQDPGANLVSGGDGVDALVTGEGADILSGGPGSDVLVAGAGNDILIGGLGSDRLTGGADADIFVIRAEDFANGSGIVADFITDFQPGLDTIELSGFAGIEAATDVSFAVLPTGVALNLGDQRFVVIEGLSEQDLLPGDITVLPEGRTLDLAPIGQVMLLTDADDRFVTQDPGINEVIAGAGNDVVVTGLGNDLLIGGPGSDVLIGGGVPPLKWSTHWDRIIPL